MKDLYFSNNDYLTFLILMKSHPSTGEAAGGPRTYIGRSECWVSTLTANQDANHTLRKFRERQSYKHWR